MCSGSPESCCDGLACIDYHCRVPGDDRLPVLAACVYDEQCSQAGGVTICGTNARGAGCCRVENQPAGHWDACCEPLQPVDGVCRY